MKKSLIFCLTILFASTCSLIADAAGTLTYIPETCTSVVTCKNMQGDAGLKWLYNSWLSSPRDNSVIRPFIQTVGLKELSVGIFPPQNDYTIGMIIVFEVPSDAKIDIEGINRVILKGLNAKEVELKNLEYKGNKITYAHNMPIKDSLSAYCIKESIIILATNSDLLKKALDGPAVTGSPHYKNALSLIPGSRDGIYFAENSGARFAQFLKPLEEKWKLSLLLSVEDLLWMGSSFDIVDSNKVTGEIIFLGADNTKMDDIIDDAEFIGEAFKRKFTAEKIKYTGVVDVTENKVKLTFEIEGLEPLWTSLFKNGVIDTLMSK